jgi:hypothetical protein
MPFDKEFEFRKLRIGIKKAVLDRKQGSFNRALWYGGQSGPARLAAGGGSYVADKATSLPGMVAKPVITVITAPFLTPLGGAAVGFLVGKMMDAADGAIMPRVAAKAKEGSRWLKGLDQGLDTSTSFGAGLQKLKTDSIPYRSPGHQAR